MLFKVNTFCLAHQNTDFGAFDGYPPIDIKLKDKNRYCYCLQSYQGADENDMPMIRMVESYVQDAIIQRIQILEKARDLSR